MKKYSSRRRRYSGKRRYKKSTAKKFGSRMQKQASTYIRKRYTKVFLLDARLNGEVAQKTVSIIGGKNATDPTGTINLFSVD